MSFSISLAAFKYRFGFERRKTNLNKLISNHKLFLSKKIGLKFGCHAGHLDVHSYFMSYQNFVGTVYSRTVSKSCFRILAYNFQNVKRAFPKRQKWSVAGET